MDPLTIGFIAFVALAIVLFVLIKGFGGSDDTAFEKAYKERGLLTEDKEKPKKQKTVKPKKEKAKHHEKPSEVVLLESKSESEKENMPLKETVTEPKKADKKEVKVEEKVDEYKEQAPADIESDGKKKRNKKSPKKEDSPKQEIIVEPELKVETVEPVFTEAKPKKAKKPKEKHAPPSVSAPILSLTELDLEKVISRFSNIEEVEPEYIGFLAQFAHDNSAQEKKLMSELATARAQIGEVEKKVKLHDTARFDAEKALQLAQKNAREASEKAHQAAAAEQAKARQISALNEENAKVRAEIVRLQQSLAEKAAQPVVTVEMINREKETDNLRQELRTATSRVQQLERDLRAATESQNGASKNADAQQKKFEEEIRMLRKSHEDELVGREVLLTEAKNNVRLISERLKEVESKTASAGDADAFKEKADALEKELTAITAQWAEKEKMHLADLNALQSLVDQLKAEVTHFEAFKAQLSAKEKELEEKTRRLKEAETLIHDSGDTQKSLLSENEKIRAELSRVTAALEEERSRSATLQKEIVSLSERKPDVVEIPYNNTPVEEVVLLKKSNALASAPPSSDSGELSRLADENAKLKAKNSELRERNFAILDNVTELEKRLAAKVNGEEKENKKKDEGNKKNSNNNNDVSSEQVATERKLVFAAISKVLPKTPALDEKADKNKYEKWLNSCAEALKKMKEDENKTTNAPAKEKKPSPAPSSDSSDVERLREENENYKEALSVLTDELQNIASLTAEREAEFLQRITELESKAGKTEALRPCRLAQELRQCAEIKKQIITLRAAIDGTPSNGSRVSPPISSSRSEEDWEVVSSS